MALTTIVSYPERGEGGSNKWRGNCSPKLVEDLIGFYHPKEICDFMSGSGTTKAAADKFGVTSHLFDLHSGFDIMNCEIPVISEFTFWHPPYWDIIKFSGVMYSAEEVEAKYGYDPRKTDLSRIPSWDEFVKAMNYAMMKQFNALEKGGRMAVLMGDVKRKGKLYSMLAEIAKPGTLEQIIIKEQHNCNSSNTVYSGNFIPIVHEYLMIVRKDNPLQFPVMLARTVQADIRDMENCTWRDVVAAVMQNTTGSVSLEYLYSQIEPHKKAQQNPNWKAKVRQVLQQNDSYFHHDARGMWSYHRAAA